MSQWALCPGWPLRRNYSFLVATRLVRAFAFGMGAVVLGVHLERRGLSPTEVGLTLTVGLLAAALIGLASAAASARIGRRVTLAVTGLLMSLSGLDLGLSMAHPLLVLAGATGMLGVAGVDGGPFLSIEQAVLTETVDSQGRNRAFGRYSLTGALAGAGGSLAAGLGTDVRRSSALFVAFALLGLVTAILPLFLTSAVEGEPHQPAFGSLRPLLGLSALFALDAFGGGLIANSVIAYWLHVRFGAGTEILGPVFTLMGLVVAGSYEVAGRLADRIGLVNTMIFTHLPSSVLLLAVPFSPNLGWALAILLFRNAISQMDIPARQAYLVSIVKPSERAGALAITGAVRGFGLAFGPLIAGFAIQAAAFGLPFFLGGGAKVGYDVALYGGFRNLRGDHEKAVGGPLEGSDPHAR